MIKHYEQKEINVLDIEPSAYNARTHSDKQVEQIVASIKEFGFANPLLVDEKGCLIAGHGRLQAAKMLEMETVPAVVLTGLTKKQKRAYMIADNQIALNSGWDFDMLKSELLSLHEGSFDINTLGFEEKFTDNILGFADLSGFGDKNKELDIDDFGDEMILKFTFSSDDYEAVRTKLNEFGDSPEEALLAVLEL